MTKQVLSISNHTTVLVLAVLLTSTASAQNLLFNPGFEFGAGADAEDWEELAGPAGSTTRSSAMPNSGDFSLYLEVDHVNNPAAGAAYFAQQVQPVGTIDNTENYDVSFRAKVDTVDFEGIDFFFQLQWLDQDASDGGGVVGEELVSLVPEGIGTSYQTFGRSNLDVPDAADSFLLRFQLSAGAVENIANGLYIDDALLQIAVPSDDLLGDYNADDFVNAADYTALRDNFGTAPSTLPNDATPSGVGLDDHAAFVASFGGAAGPLLLPATIAIPEPSSVLFAAAGLLAIAQRRARTGRLAC